MNLWSWRNAEDAAYVGVPECPYLDRYADHIGPRWANAPIYKQ